MDKPPSKLPPEARRELYALLALGLATGVVMWLIGQVINALFR